jgi:cytochrome b561
MRDVSISTEYVYGPVQRGFHWLMAALVIVAIGVGLYAVDLPKEDPSKGVLFGLHKSLGMTVLILVVLRIVWRVIKGAPPYRVALDRFSWLAASGTHAALYVLMIFLPIVGYVLSTAADRPVSLFGLYTFPRLFAPDKPLAKLAENAHVTGAWILIWIIALHIAAALWHYFFKRDEVMARMAPRLTQKSDG